MIDSVGSKASLSNYNNELVRLLEEFREKRDEVLQSILQDEEQKAMIQKEISQLTDRLTKLNESLERKMQAKEGYDKVIHEAEGAYSKILESSETMLTVLRKEKDTLAKKR